MKMPSISTLYIGVSLSVWMALDSKEILFD